MIVWTNTRLAIAWTGAQNSVWSNANNWEGTILPTSDDDVFIPNVTNDPIVSNTQYARTMTVQTGGFVTISAGDTLVLTGSLSNAGILLLQNNSFLMVAGSYENTGSLTTNASTFVFTPNFCLYV